MEHAVVAGGAGFIGSHLCAALLDRGLSVTAVDNLSTGSTRNLVALRQHPGFTLLEHDVVQPLPTLRPVDLLYHLASPASVPDYLSRPLATLRVNSLGTLNLLERAREDGARFLFASTSEIYGDPLVHPQPETYWGNVSSTGPRACYDESKRFGETATLTYQATYGMNARVVRIFNTYGPHSRPDDGRIVPNFITQALCAEPITVYGDGSQTRSFCYVSDLVAGLIASMTAPRTTGEVINLGNPDEYTVLQFAELIARVVGTDVGVTRHPLPIDDPTRRCPDITKAKRLLGWEPEIDLTVGLERTIHWFRDLLQAPVEVQ
ncbi:MAG: UDP-glucuronic acid decarboxylase family protein [Chloroflexota bacterium]